MFPLPSQKAAAGHADGFIDAGALQDLPVNGRTTVIVGFTRVLVLRTADDRLHAIADLCPHALQPLAEGAIEGDSIRCPKHGASFDLASGKPLNQVTAKPLTLFQVRLREGRVEVAPPER